MIRHIALAAAVALSLSAVACAAPTESPSTSGTESSDLVSKKAHFEAFVGSDSQHYFRFVAANGEELLRSEGYTSESGVEAGEASVVTSGCDEHNLELHQAADGTWYFDVKAGNGEIVATSGFYSRKDSAERGTRAVRSLLWDLR